MSRLLLGKQIWTMALRNVARRPRRSFLSIVAIGMASLTVVCLFALVAGLRLDQAQNLQRYSSGQILVEDGGLYRAGAQALSLAIPQATDLKARFESVPGVVSASPRVSGAASVFVDGDAVFFPFLGMDFSTDPMNLSEFLGSGGKMPSAGEREALVSTGLAEKLGLRVGSRFEILTQTLRGSSNGMTMTVTGIVHPGLGAFQTPWLFTSVETARRLVHLGDGATSILIRLTPDADPRTTAPKIQAVVDQGGPQGVFARPWFEGSASYSLLELAQVMYAFIGLVFAALASTVVINTMLMVVLERSKEIGMLGALGMEPRTIRNLFLAEGAILSGIGAAAGAVVGTVISIVLGITGLDYGEAMKGVQIEVTSIIRPHLDPWLPLEVFLLCTAVALLFTLVPVARLKKMPIADAMRGEV